MPAADPVSAPLSPVETLPIPPAVVTAPQPELPPKPITDMKPECLLASTLSIKGDMTFERLLRIDGKFEGTLTSNGGSLIVGITGDIKCNLTNMREVYIEGKVSHCSGALNSAHYRCTRLESNACHLVITSLGLAVAVVVGRFTP
jgi:Polymer-forming cytoskeletal